MTEWEPWIVINANAKWFHDQINFDWAQVNIAAAISTKSQ